MLKEIIKKVRLPFVLSLVGFLLGYLLQLFLTNNLGVAVYGELSYLLSIVTTLTVLTKFGFDRASIKHIPALIINKKNKDTIDYFKSGFLVSGLILTASIFTILSFDKLVPDNVSDNQLMILTFCLTYTLMIQGYLQALKYPSLSQLPEKYVKPMIIILTISVGNFYEYDVNIFTIYSLGFSVALIISVLSFFYILKKNHLQFDFKFPKFKKKWGVDATTLCLMSGIYALFANVDVMMIHHMLSSRDVAIYSISIKCAYLLAFPLNTITTVIAPLISESYSRGDLKTVGSLAQKGAFLSIVASGIGMLFLFLFGESFLKLFGLEYIESYESMMLLTLAQVLSCFFGMASTTISVSKRTEVTLIILLIGLLFNIVSNYILIPILGINGAAYATILSNLIWGVIATAYVKIKYGINITALGIIKWKK